MWQRTFVGVSVLLGERLDEACEALPARDAPSEALAQTLRDAARPVRARALADVAEETLRAVREATLR